MDYDNDNSTDYGTDNGNSADGPWVNALNRKKRRLSTRQSPIRASQVSTNQAHRQSADQRLWSDRVSAPSNSQNTVRLNVKPTTRNTVIGRASPSNNNASKLKSAKPYVKKLVYGVYNVEHSESVSSIQDFIEQSCGVQAITCFQIKSRSTESIAFRVCIDASVNEQFLNPDIW